MVQFEDIDRFHRARDILFFTSMGLLSFWLLIVPMVWMIVFDKWYNRKQRNENC